VNEAEEMAGKIAEAEAAQEYMKRANAIIRKHRTNPEAAIPTLISELQMSEEGARKITTPNRMNDVGYPRYLLTNNNANIRRMKDRLVELQRKEAASDQKKSLDFDGGTIKMDFQKDRLSRQAGRRDESQAEKLRFPLGAVEYRMATPIDRTGAPQHGCRCRWY
jgi:hypothetical protein